MALIGGGGAGNVAGSNPTGTGGSLNYIGDHCYAYSGGFGATTTAQTTLEFETGGQYIVGEMLTLGGVAFDTTGGLKSAFRISINGEVVAVTLIDNQTDHSTSNNSIPMLLAPYSRVKVEVDSDDTNANVLSTTIFTGRVYA